jgi:hypothetical protein
MAEPPVDISGFFERESTPEYEAYRGGLLVSIQPYALLAVGAYQHTTKPVDFKSVFVYARLDGPLFTLEFAEITGVAASFGHNFDLRLPKVEEVLNFPLVHTQAAVQNPMQLMASTGDSSFVSWTAAVQGSNFFSVGLKVNAFQILTIDAALVVGLAADSLKISIVGIASASMPPMTGKPPEAYLYAELGVIATIDITGGSLFAAAQLTANSYVLAPDCHLTGGFALCYWFGKSPFAGDWVFTVGGYHPAFKPASYWPVPPRLGISWNLSDVLTVRGEAFFAVTPNVIMGGGRLLAVFNAGPIYASFEAWASFLIKFKPFYFIADIGVRISVGFRISIGLIHINIHVDMGASLHLQGPPFGGSASVDMGLIGFTVYFGDQNTEPDPLTWDQFLDVVRKPGLGSAETKSVDLVVIALENGSASDKTTDASSTAGDIKRNTGDKWFVRANALRFRIESKMPMDSAKIGDGFKSVNFHPQQDPIFARLTHEPTAVTSVMTVTITAPIPLTSAADDLENPWNVTPFIRGLPNALWKQCRPLPLPLPPPFFFFSFGAHTRHFLTHHRRHQSRRPHQVQRQQWHRVDPKRFGHRRHHRPAPRGLELRAAQVALPDEEHPALQRHRRDEGGRLPGRPLQSPRRQEAAAEDPGHGRRRPETGPEGLGVRPDG